MDFDNKNLFSVDTQDSSSDDEVSFLGLVGGVIAAPFILYFGAFEKGINFLTNNSDNKRGLHKAIENIRVSFDVNDFLESLIDRKDEVITDVKTAILDDLLTPMQSQLEEIINNVADKEKALKEAIKKEKELECRLSDFNAQYSKVYQS